MNWRRNSHKHSPVKLQNMSPDGYLGMRWAYFNVVFITPGLGWLSNAMVLFPFLAVGRA